MAENLERINEAIPIYRPSYDEETLKAAAQALRNYVVMAHSRGDEQEHVVAQLVTRGWPKEVVAKYAAHYYTQQKQRQQRMQSLVVFGLLVAVVGAFYLLSEPTITGLTVTGLTVLDNQMIFGENTTFDLGMKVTSLRISGNVRGVGSAHVYLGESLVAEFVLNESEVSIPVVPELPNVTINGTNETITNDSVVGIVENALNETAENVTANEMAPRNTTLSIDFVDVCIETCGNISGSLLRIEINGVLLTITQFNYTVETALPELNGSMNVTINATNLTNETRILPKVALKNRRNIDAGRFELRNNTDGTFEIEFHTRPAGGVGLALVESNVVLRGVRDTENVTAKIDAYVGDGPRGGEITTDVVAVTNVTLDNGTVRLVKNGDVNTIVKCTDFDIDTFTCATWQRTSIPFIDWGDLIEFTVDSFSGYGGAQLSIITVESRPRLGENWTVLFNTTGAANLTIKAVNGTTWGDNADIGDLRFIEVRCGDVV